MTIAVRQSSMHYNVWHPACRIMKSKESVSEVLLGKVIYYVNLRLLSRYFTA
jgi:hypothetical protein